MAADQLFPKKRSERGFASQVNADGGGEGEPDSNLHAKKKTKIMSFRSCS
jgi:hypothetical protein